MSICCVTENKSYTYNIQHNIILYKSTYILSSGLGVDIRIIISKCVPIDAVFSYFVPFCSAPNQLFFDYVMTTTFHRFLIIIRLK